MICARDMIRNGLKLGVNVPGHLFYLNLVIGPGKTLNNDNSLPGHGQYFCSSSPEPDSLVTIYDLMMCISIYQEAEQQLFFFKRYFHNARVSLLC